MTLPPGCRRDERNPVPAAPTTVAALRSLLAARFPERIRRAGGVVATGVRSVDDALGGGLAASRLTELVSAAPGSGGQTVIAQLLRTTRAARQRVCLIDGGDGFVPAELPTDALRHLVWVRGRSATDTLAVADILVRDGNYAVVLIDLRGLPERALLKIPTTTWHRLRHATESGPVAVLVQSAFPLVPAVPWRLVLHAPMGLAARRTARAVLADAFTVDVVRGHADVEERSA